jgi:hypothetical protein
MREFELEDEDEASWWCCEVAGFFELEEDEEEDF